MAMSREPVQKLFEQAILAWSKPDMIHDSPSWNGRPEQRALCEALAERISQSESLLYSGLSHDDQHVVAYCLLALNLGLSIRLRQLPEALEADKRHVTINRGSFTKNIQIGDLARELRKKLG
jgi:hypothetical protein